MTCPHLEYRRAAGDKEFDHERAYCDVMEAFVAPMTADVCNDRHTFHHETHCDVYQEHHAEDFEEGETVRPPEVEAVKVPEESDD